MGRTDKSFEAVFQELSISLRAFRDALIDLPRRDALDKFSSAWNRESRALRNAGIPAVLDAMILTALVENRKLLLELSRLTEALKSTIEELGNMFS